LSVDSAMLDGIVTGAEVGGNNGVEELAVSTSWVNTLTGVGVESLTGETSQDNWTLTGTSGLVVDLG